MSANKSQLMVNNNCSFLSLIVQFLPFAFRHKISIRTLLKEVGNPNEGIHEPIGKLFMWTGLIQVNEVFDAVE